MLRVVRNLSRPIKSFPAEKFCNFRAFSEKLTIPTDKEQQTGRRKEELDAEAAGSVGFNNEPIIPPSDAGTKENPIMVIIELLYFVYDFQNEIYTNLYLMWLVFRYGKNL